MEHIKKEMNATNMPERLAYLPHVESSFNYLAYSKVGAAGIWQFTRSTGRLYSMKINYIQDERKDPIISTKAAIRLLKSNYNRFRNWPLSITAYNHGPGGLKKAIRRLKTKDISIIVDKYKNPRFGFASQNFYSEFLAALYVTVYSDRLFSDIKKEQPMSFSYLSVEKDINIDKLSEISGLSIKDITSYNPEFSKKITKNIIPIKKGSTIKLPPRASYKLEEYFLKYSDRSQMEQRKSKRDDLNVPELN